VIDDMRERLDKMLVARGLAETRSRARDLILRGEVRVAGDIETRPAAHVLEGKVIEVAAGAAANVSRGAVKLAAALDTFAFNPAGRTALDVGASTGGFTQVLLARGAVRVYAVDVGRGQLHERVRTDARVVALEATDARDLDRAHVPEPVAAVVADVSFISLRKALPAALALAAPGAWLVALIKPQFELGPASVGKGGIVRDAVARREAVARVTDWIRQDAGWRIAGVIVSPLRGGSGNEEYLLGAMRDG
jgi:23S rRNA (cytidine1920-2'-O)/16S rRNA (cytidine1409-2'-O)-methyltransferase